jgi:hypothetical protein
MNDLDLITGLTPDVPLPGPEDLAPARARLASAIQAATRAERITLFSAPEPAAVAPEGGSAARRQRRNARSLALGLPLRLARWPASRARLAIAGGVLAGAAAIVVAMAFIVTTLAAPAPQGKGTGVASPGAEPAATGSGPEQTPATINVAAARFLEQAAAVVQQQPAKMPGRNQFVYTENNEGGGRIERQWLSTDGNRPGLDKIWQGSRLLRDKAIAPCTVAEDEEAMRTAGKVDNCVEEAGYLSGMPASPQKLLAYLVKIGMADPEDTYPGGAANDLGKAVEEMLPYTYLTPAQQAALFQLMAQTPGFTIVRGVRDAAGRSGTGIEWDFMGVGPATVIIFNPVTFAYMGMASLGKGGESQPSALVRMAFVNKAGQLP